MQQHYSAVDYYQLGRVYPRDRLRQPWSRQRRISVPPNGPTVIVNPTSGAITALQLYQPGVVALDPFLPSVDALQTYVPSVVSLQDSP